LKETSFHKRYDMKEDDAQVTSEVNFVMTE